MNTHVVVDSIASTITVPHWGITLRCLFGAALKQWQGAPGEVREFTVIYKDAVIGAIKVRQHKEKP